MSTRRVSVRGSEFESTANGMGLQRRIGGKRPAGGEGSGSVPPVMVIDFKRQRQKDAAAQSVRACPGTVKSPRSSRISTGLLPSIETWLGKVGGIVGVQ